VNNPGQGVGVDIFRKTVVRSNGLVSRIIDGEAFLVTKEGKEIHMINKVGTVIWECADGSFFIEDIIANILKRFDIDPETAKADCLQFIHELSDMKLLSVTEKV